MPANLAKLRKIGHYTGRRNQTDPLDRTQSSNFFTVQAFSALTDHFFYRLNGSTQIVDMTLQRGFDCLRRRSLKPALVVISLLNKVFPRSEEHTSELHSLMRISYAVVRLTNDMTIVALYCT